MVNEKIEDEFCKQQQQQERHDELQYLDQVRHVIKNGKTKSDRTGVGTKSVFGAYSRYNLKDST
jgi:thymidylate synthase